MRHAKSYRLYFRRDTGYFFYKTPEQGWKTTGKSKEHDAHRFVIEKVLTVKGKEPKQRALTLKAYALPSLEQHVAARAVAGSQEKAERQLRFRVPALHRTVHCYGPDGRDPPPGPDGGTWWQTHLRKTLKTAGIKRDRSP